MTTTELWDAIAAALVPLGAEIDGLQVLGRGMLNPNPTPPSLDVYPGDPFLTGAGMGVGQSRAYFTIRARVGTADSEAGQRLLVRLLDPQDPASVEAAVQDVAVVVPDGTSGFREYDAGEGNRLLGAEWRVSQFL
jgi:hypothetical protein